MQKREREERKESRICHLRGNKKGQERGLECQKNIFIVGYAFESGSIAQSATSA